MNIYAFWLAVLAQDRDAIRSYFRGDAHRYEHQMTQEFPGKDRLSGSFLCSNPIDK